LCVCVCGCECCWLFIFCSKGKGKEKDGRPLNGEEEWILAGDSSVQWHHQCKSRKQAAVVAIGDFHFCLLHRSSVCAGNSFCKVFFCIVLPVLVLPFRFTVP
jgi:hypothetical protein